MKFSNSDEVLCSSCGRSAPAAAVIKYIVENYFPNLLENYNLTGKAEIPLTALKMLKCKKCGSSAASIFPKNESIGFHEELRNHYEDQDFYNKSEEDLMSDEEHYRKSLLERDSFR
jgi:hypothetical protein